MKSTNYTKYFKYAIGEIILVVIGILIALAINDWNTKRIDKTNIEEYYKKIMVEIDENIDYFDKLLARRVIFKKHATEAMRLLDKNNTDSIPQLIEGIGSIRNINSINMSFPIIDEFLTQNYLSKVENDTIKSLFSEYKEMVQFTDLVDAYSISQYQNSIESFLLENINYSEIPLNGLEDLTLKGGPRTNTEQLRNNLKLWNLLYVKIETWEFENNSLRWGKELLTELRSALNNELKN